MNARERAVLTDRITEAKRYADRSVGVLDVAISVAVYRALVELKEAMEGEL